MIAFSVSPSNPFEMKFFFRISREKVHLFDIANVHRHHPPISFTLISHCVCRDYTLWQIAIKAILHWTWNMGKRTSLVILFDICAVCNWNGRRRRWPIQACFPSTTSTFFTLYTHAIRIFFLETWGLNYWHPFFSSFLLLSKNRFLNLQAFVLWRESKEVFQLKSKKKIKFQFSLLFLIDFF